jgi:hypothetical protein
MHGGVVKDGRASLEKLMSLGVPDFKCRIVMIISYKFSHVCMVVALMTDLRMVEILDVATKRMGISNTWR